MGGIIGVIATPLRIIGGESGNVLHAMKATEESYHGFGEAYFSSVLKDAKKGWKKHRKMVLNLVVVSGAIRFVLFDDRPGSETYHSFQEFVLSLENYQRLTVPPGIWMAFTGLTDETNLLLNIASIPHDPLEAENLPLQNAVIPYKGF
jgi:dTDP-4-dehydrorhamnose 3,5-epimerase